MELVDHAQRPEPAQATPQVLVITRGEHATTVLAEPPDGVGVSGCEAITDVDRHQPQLVVAELVEPAEDRVAVGTVGPVTRGHVVAGRPQLARQQ